MYEMHKVRSDFYFLKYNGLSWPTSSNIFLIRDKDGLNMFDTGLNNEAVFEGLSNCLRQIGCEVSDIHTVVLTHGHADHIAGMNIIKKFCNPRVFLPKKCIPEATCLKAQEDAVLSRHVREIAPRLRDFDIIEEACDSCGEWLLRDLDLLPIEDHDEMNLGKYSFRAILTPGHDIGLMVFFEPEIKLLLSTDFLRASIPGNALPWYSSRSGGVTAYLQGLDRIEKMSIDKAFPSHGILSGNIRERIRETRDVILDRQNKIINALKQEPKTCEELDPILYTPLALKLCPWFSSITEAHLRYSEREGLIKRDKLKYRLRSC